MNRDLQRFVREALARGVPADRIRSALLQARWPEDEVNAALTAWEDAGIGVPVPRRRVQLSAREAFLYLLLFATLYLVAWHVGSILFAVIERGLPDPAVDDSAWDRRRQAVRLGVASIVVAFPVFLWTSRLLGRAIATDLEKRASGVRRWLTYLTLFVAACVLIGDFTAVVLGLLSGEITARFALKALVVGAIAGALFAHYLGGLRADEGDGPPRRGATPLARVAAVVVLVTLAAGFWLSGSPARVRREQLDQRRLTDLQHLSGVVQNYHHQFGTLPSRLEDVAAAGAIPPRTAMRDPVSREPYGYRVVDSLAFELCATFDTADSVGPYEDRTSEFWRHGPGRHCFRFRAPRRP